MPQASTRSSQARSRSVRTCRAAIHTSGLNQCSAHASCAMTCVRQSRRFTCASSCSSTMRRRSSGHRLASSGIRTAGVKMPARHRHRRARAFEEAKPPRDAQPGCELHGERQPRCVDNADGSTRHPLHGDEAEQQPRDDSDGANGPDRREDASPPTALSRPLEPARSLVRLSWSETVVRLVAGCGPSPA